MYMNKYGISKYGINKYGIKEGNLPFLTIFTAGIVAGIFFMNLGKSILLENTGLLDEYTLYDMKYMTVDSSALFYYVVKQRLGSVLVLAVLATTYLGLVVCGGFVLWYGLCTGAFLATAVIRYGIKGILLVLVGIFPQYLIYVPAVMGMLVWCRKLYRAIYLDRSFTAEWTNSFGLPKCLLQLAGILCVLVVGCVLESFLNPLFVQALLKIF